MTPPKANELDHAIYQAVQDVLYRFYGSAAFKTGYGQEAIYAAKRAVVDTTLKLHGSKLSAAKLSGLSRNTYQNYGK